MALTKTDKTFIKSLIKPLGKRVGSLENKTNTLGKRVGSLENKTNTLGKRVGNLTKQHLLLSNRVERGFKEVTENQAKFRNETLNGFDQVLTEIKEMRQENQAFYDEDIKNLTPE